MVRVCCQQAGASALSIQRTQPFMLLARPALCAALRQAAHVMGQRCQRCCTE